MITKGHGGHSQAFRLSVLQPTVHFLFELGGGGAASIAITSTIRRERLLERM
jgi:hypothetical protein